MTAHEADESRHPVEVEVEIEVNSCQRLEKFQKTASDGSENGRAPMVARHDDAKPKERQRGQRLGRYPGPK